MTIYDVGFYNVEESRPRDQVHREILGLIHHGSVDGDALDVLGLAELIGNTAPKAPEGWRRIRSLKTPGRANLGAYVRRSLYKSHRWVQQELTWIRPKHPNLGRHPARAILVITLKDDTQIVVDHFPQRPFGVAGPSLVAARREYEEDLVKVMAPAKDTEAGRIAAKKRARIIIGDQNASATHPLLRDLAEKVPLWWHGHSVDLIGKTRNVDLTGPVMYPERVGDVELGSDHHHSIAARLQVRAA